MQLEAQAEAAEAFSNHLRTTDVIMAGQLPDLAAADHHVMLAAEIAVEGSWTANVIWQTYQAAGATLSPEKRIFALAKLRLEATASLDGREITDRMLFAFEDAERIDMLTVRETAFAPEYLPTH